MNTDIPENVIVAGVPAKIIGNFQEFVQKRVNIEQYPCQPVIGQYVPSDLESWLWKRFYDKRN